MIISFITINYNSAKYTIELIKSIEKFTTLTYEIIIVDNDSKNADYLKLKTFTTNKKHIRLIKNNTNVGFSSANMLAVKYSKSKYFFFINNDTVLLNDVSLLLSKYLNNYPDVSLATAKVNDQHSNYSSSYKLFPSVIKELLGNIIARKYSNHHFPSNKQKIYSPTLVEVVSGSCMFFRSVDFNQLNGFDTNFFLYCEEEDLSKRVWLSGKKVVFIPEAEIMHYAGGSTTKSFEIEREYYISYFILLEKHFNLSNILILKTLTLFKLFRRSFKRKNGWKLFLCALKNCPKSLSLRNIQ
jgi:GT2 family glycosyltransferase